MKNAIKTIKKSVVMVLTNNGKGTGFFVNSNGSIFTCAHNIINPQTNNFAENIRIIYENTIYDVLPKDITIDQTYDFAIIRINKTENNFPFLKIKDEFGSIEEGENILFSGFPLNIDYIITHQGIISSKQTTDINRTREINAYQIDRQIIHGFSGGPLCLESSGECIGIIVAEVPPEQRETLINKIRVLVPNSVSMGHAVSIEYANKKLKELTNGIKS